MQEQELLRLRLDYERVSQERTVRGPEDIARFQTSLKELQLQKQKAEEELARLKRAAFRRLLQEEEAGGRSWRAWAEDPKEQAIKVTSLTQQLEQASIVKKRSEDELRQQRDVLDGHLREKQRTQDELRRLASEAEALRRQLLQEQESAQAGTGSAQRALPEGHRGQEPEPEREQDRD